MHELHVKPAVGLVVRDPVTLAQIPADGTMVPANTFWLRRIADGTVVEVKAVQATARPSRAQEG